MWDPLSELDMKERLSFDFEYIMQKETIISHYYRVTWNYMKSEIVDLIRTALAPVVSV